MEIERKYLVTSPPDGYRTFPGRLIEQAYLCTDPVVRVRQEASYDAGSPEPSESSWYLTYKGKGHMVREEYNLPLTHESYLHLLAKADGNVLTKKRYLIPLEGTGLTIEFDVFEGKFQGLMLAEVEFPTEEEANCFVPPAWFDQDVTFTGEYQNSRLSGQDRLF